MEATNSALVVPAETEEPTLSDIHDIRSVVELPSTWDWLWWVIGVIAVAALAYWAIRYWLRKRQQNKTESVAASEPAHERARRELEAALDYLHDPDQFCVMVSDAIRVYLEGRFDLHAPDRTTEEFLDELRDGAALNTEQQHSLAQFLTECDMVKFAKSAPEAFELKRLHESALQLVQETEPGLMEHSDESDETNPS